MLAGACASSRSDLTSLKRVQILAMHASCGAIVCATTRIELESPEDPALRAQGRPSDSSVGVRRGRRCVVQRSLKRPPSGRACPRIVSRPRRLPRLCCQPHSRRSLAWDPRCSPDAYRGRELDTSSPGRRRASGGGALTGGGVTGGGALGEFLGHCAAVDAHSESIVGKATAEG